MPYLSFVVDLFNYTELYSCTDLICKKTYTEILSSNFIDISGTIVQNYNIFFYFKKNDVATGTDLEAV